MFLSARSSCGGPLSNDSEGRVAVGAATAEVGAEVAVAVDFLGMLFDWYT